MQYGTSKGFLQPDQKAGRVSWKTDDQKHESKYAYKVESIIEGMHNYTVEDLTLALKNGGFSKVKAEHHAKKPWITVLAKKEGVE